MTRLLLDQGLPRSAAAILREAGWDVSHAGECGLSAATDSIILEAARLEQRHVITLDADFHSLLAVSGAKGPSVIRLRIEGLKGDDLASLLVRLWPKVALAMAEGAVVTVARGIVRTKRLPIGR